MAITLETTTQTITKEERTKEIVISTPKNEDPLITIFREQVTTSSDGTILGIDQVGVVVRHLSEVMDTPFTVGGMTLTGAQLATTIAAVADQLREQDTNEK